MHGWRDSTRYHDDPNIFLFSYIVRWTKRILGSESSLTGTYPTLDHLEETGPDPEPDPNAFFFMGYRFDWDFESRSGSHLSEEGRRNTSQII